MKSPLARIALTLALVVIISAAGYGSAFATTITGTLNFGANPTNYYDPAKGFVPGGFGNSSGQPVLVGAGVEFGFQDDFNRDTANFTSTSLVITDLVFVESAPWTQTFTADTAGFFNGLKLTSDTLGGVTYSLLGDTLTVNWGGTASPGEGSVTFGFDGPAQVPLPAALPLFATILVGGGLIAWRRKRRAAAKA